jgi:septal ring factor EnvC (AmiA/AmiB activator)
MSIRIEIPNELRERIVAFKESLNRELAEYKHGVELANAAISQFQNELQAVNEQISIIEQSSELLTDDAVDKYCRLTAKREMLKARLQFSTRRGEEIAEHEVKINFQLIEEVRLFYIRNLPEKIAESLRTVYLDMDAARRAAEQSPTFQSLYRLRDAIMHLHVRTATESNVRFVYSILDRALQGSPSLTFDSPKQTANV